MDARRTVEALQLDLAAVHEAESLSGAKLGDDVRDEDPAGLGARAQARCELHGCTEQFSVLLERPKLLPHVPAIRENLARTLGVDVQAVSVKGKSNEGVDAVGRGEAIASHAVALLAEHRS